MGLGLGKRSLRDNYTTFTHRQYSFHWWHCCTKAKWSSLFVAREWERGSEKNKRIRFVCRFSFGTYCLSIRTACPVFWESTYIFDEWLIYLYIHCYRLWLCAFFRPFYSFKCFFVPPSLLVAVYFRLLFYLVGFLIFFFILSLVK